LKTTISRIPTSFADAVKPAENNTCTKPKSKLNPSAVEFVPFWTQSAPTAVEAQEICPEWADTGTCWYRENELVCPHKLHGNQCPICTLYVLDPENESAHLNKCNFENEDLNSEEYKKNKSKDLQCTVCYDIVWEKPNPAHQRFGILENCDHVFCLGCIREWRANTNSDKSAVKGCPTCRKESHFVIPSKWFVDGQEKELLIDSYKIALSEKECRYYDKGRGSCPFGTSCFYKHQNADGTLQDRSVPVRPTFRYNADGERVSINASHEIFEVLQQYLDLNEEHLSSLTDDQLLIQELQQAFEDEFAISENSDEYLDYYYDNQFGDSDSEY